MIHLVTKKTKDGERLQVLNVANNHEILNESKPLTTRKGAFKNIRAAAEQLGSPDQYRIRVQDDTSDTPRILEITRDRVYHTDERPRGRFNP